MSDLAGWRLGWTWPGLVVCAKLRTVKKGQGSVGSSSTTWILEVKEAAVVVCQARLEQLRCSQSWYHVALVVERHDYSSSN